MNLWGWIPVGRLIMVNIVNPIQVCMAEDTCMHQSFQTAEAG